MADLRRCWTLGPVRDVDGKMMVCLLPAGHHSAHEFVRDRLGPDTVPWHRCQPEFVKVDTVKEQRM